MAGPEGERRLDLDADAVCAHARSDVRPVHSETSGLHWLEALEALAHPVGGRQRLEHKRVCRGRPGDGCDLTAHRRLIGPIAKMEHERPAPVRFFERRRGERVGVEALAESLGNPLRRGGIARQPRRHGGGRILRGCRKCSNLVGPHYSPSFIPRTRRAIYSTFNSLSTNFPRPCPSGCRPGAKLFAHTMSTALAVHFAQGCSRRRDLAAVAGKR